MAEPSRLDKPLGFTIKPAGTRAFLGLERETGFEPATSTLARSHSTTELLPLCRNDYKQALGTEQRRAILAIATSGQDAR